MDNVGWDYQQLNIALMIPSMVSSCLSQHPTYLSIVNTNIAGNSEVLSITCTLNSLTNKSLAA